MRRLWVSPTTLGEEKRTLRTSTGIKSRMLTVQQYVMKDCPASNANIRGSETLGPCPHGLTISDKTGSLLLCFPQRLSRKDGRERTWYPTSQVIKVQILWVVCWSPPNCALQSCLLRPSHLASAGSFQCQADPTSTSSPSALLLSLTRTSKSSKTGLVGCPSQDS